HSEAETEGGEAMNKRELNANVLRGVRLLDEKDPGWWNGESTPSVIGEMVGHIDLEKLDMELGCSCVLGQRQYGAEWDNGKYRRGLDAIGLTSNDDSQHGFRAVDHNGYSILTELWAAVIISRRFPRRKIAKDPFCVRANKTWKRQSACSP